VNAEGVFYNYYLFDRPGDPAWVMLKAPIPADHPRSRRWPRNCRPSTGRSARFRIGSARSHRHPNPRRVALHDTGPTCIRCAEFSARHRAGPFEGSGTSIAHARRGVFHIPVGPVHAASSSPATSTSPSPASLSCTATAHVLHAQGNRKALREYPIHRAVFLAKAFRAIRRSLTALHSARPSSRLRESRSRRGHNFCAPSCLNWNELRITSPIPGHRQRRGIRDCQRPCRPRA